MLLFGDGTAKYAKKYSIVKEFVKQVLFEDSKPLEAAWQPNP